MKIKSLIALIAGAAAANVAFVTAWHYLQWKQQQRERLLTTSHLLETPRGTVEYQIEGEGPAVLILHGTADIDAPFRQAQALSAAIPGAQLVAIEGADHLTTLARDEATAAVRHFLQQIYLRKTERG